jgi:hypothetical protein
MKSKTKTVNDNELDHIPVKETTINISRIKKIKDKNNSSF